MSCHRGKEKSPLRTRVTPPKKKEKEGLARSGSEEERKIDFESLSKKEIRHLFGAGRTGSNKRAAMQWGEGREKSGIEGE